MNYFKIYNSIIDNAKNQNRKKGKGVYFEKHHIMPKCMGGNDNKENLVILTAREHFICHMLLCEMYENKGLKFAFWAMCNQTSGDVKRDYKITNRIYEYARKNAAIEISKIDRSGEKNSFFGKKHSEKSKKLMSEKRKGQYTGEKNNFFGKKHLQKTIDQIQKSRQEWLKTEGARLKISLCNQLRKIVTINELNLEFNSIKEAAGYFNIKYSQMKYCVSKGKFENYTISSRLANSKNKEV